MKVPGGGALHTGSSHPSDSANGIRVRRSAIHPQFQSEHTASRLFPTASTSACLGLDADFGNSRQLLRHIQLVKYLTDTKGLSNVLWMAPLCGAPSADYNPGSQYIEFGGADTYASAGDAQPLTSLFQKTAAAFPNTMVALHEGGTIPDPDQLKSTGTKCLFFNVWASPYFNSPHNTTDHVQSVYSNAYVITRDKLPSFQ